MMTTGPGFPVLFVLSGSAALDGISLANEITDQFAEPGRLTSFALPFDTFAHTKADATITLKAQQQDGQDLPSWITFDAQAGTFTADPPSNLPQSQQTIKLMVVARDQEGKEAVAQFKFFIGTEKGKDKDKVSGRIGLSEQLKLAGTRATSTPWGQWVRSSETRLAGEQRSTIITRHKG